MSQKVHKSKTEAMPAVVWKGGYLGIFRGKGIAVPLAFNTRAV